MTAFLLSLLLAAPLQEQVAPPEPVASDLERGVRLFHLGRYTAAITALDSALADAPDNARAFLYRGLCRQDLHQSDGAVSDLARAHALAPDLLPAAVALARAWLDTGRLDESESMLLELIRAHPDDPDLHFILGLCMVRMGRPADAVAPLSHALTLAPLHPDAPHAHFMMATALEEAGRPSDAARERALSLEKKKWLAFLVRRQEQLRKSPEDPRIHLSLGILWMEAGRLERAGFHLEEAHRLDPTNPRTLFNRGDWHRRLGRHAEAEADWRSALDRDPAFAACLYNLGLLYAKQGRLAEAEDVLGKAWLADPDGVSDASLREVPKHLGSVAESRGDPATARRWYLLYKEKGGRDPFVERRLAVLDDG